MKRKATEATNSNSSNKKSKKNPLDQPLPISPSYDDGRRITRLRLAERMDNNDYKDAVIERQIPTTSKSQHAGKSVRFIYRAALDAPINIPFDIMNVPESKLQGRKFADQQIDSIKYIIQCGSKEHFIQKIKKLSKHFMQQGTSFTKGKAFPTWEMIFSLGEEDITEDNILIWAALQNSTDLFQVIMDETVTVRSSFKVTADYNHYEFLGNILHLLFRSHVPLQNILNIIQLDKTIKQKDGLKKYFRKVAEHIRRGERNRWEEEEAYVDFDWISNILAPNQNVNLKRWGDYYDKVVWLDKHVQPVPSNIIRQLISETIEKNAVKKSIFAHYNQDTSSLFAWLLTKEKEKNGLFELSYQGGTEHLRYLMDNRLEPKIWSVELAADIGLFYKYQELSLIGIKENAHFLENNPNLLVIALESKAYWDVEDRLKLLHYIATAQPTLLTNGQPDQLFKLLLEMTTCAAHFFNQTTFKKFDYKQENDSKQEKFDLMQQDSNRTSTNPHETYWKMTLEVFCIGILLFEQKFRSARDLRTANKVQVLATAFINLMKLEDTHRPNHICSLNVLQKFINMLKKKGDTTLLNQLGWPELFIEKNLKPNLTKVILNEFGKEGFDVSQAVIRYTTIPENKSFIPASEMLNKLNSLTDEKHIRDNIKDKNKVTLGMHLAFRCIASEDIMNVLQTLHQLGGDYTALVPSTNDEKTAENSLLISHLQGFVNHQISLSKIKKKTVKKNISKTYNEKDAFAITRFLLDVKVNPLKETTLVHHNYRYQGNVFDYVAMVNLVGEPLENRQGLLQLHEDQFFRNEQYLTFMQRARAQAQTRRMGGPNFVLLPEIQIQPGVMLRPGVTIVRPQAFQPQANSRSNAPMRIHQDKQNTHGEAVHQQTAKAAQELRDVYFKSYVGGFLKQILDKTFVEIVAFYKKQILEDAKSIIEKMFPNDFCMGNYNHGMMNHLLNSIEKDTLDQSVGETYLKNPNALVPQLWDVDSFIAFRWLMLSAPRVLEFQEKRTGISLKECLCFVWLGLHDKVLCTNKDTPAALRLFTKRLVEMQREYPELVEQDTTGMDESASTTCPGGAFNQLISSLEGQHKLVPIINRISRLTLFDFIAGYYEKVFAGIKNDTQKFYRYFNELLNKSIDELDDTVLPIAFVKDFERGFYEERKHDLSQKFIEEKDIKELFYNDMVPFVLTRFPSILEHFKIAKKNQHSQSSSNSNSGAHFGGKTKPNSMLATLSLFNGIQQQPTQGGLGMGSKITCLPESDDECNSDSESSMMESDNKPIKNSGLISGDFQPLITQQQMLMQSQQQTLHPSYLEQLRQQEQKTQMTMPMMQPAIPKNPWPTGYQEHFPLSQQGQQSQNQQQQLLMQQQQYQQSLNQQQQYQQSQNQQQQLLMQQQQQQQQQQQLLMQQQQYQPLAMQQPLLYPDQEPMMDNQSPLLLQSQEGQPLAEPLLMSPRLNPISPLNSLSSLNPPSPLPTYNGYNFLNDDLDYLNLGDTGQNGVSYDQQVNGLARRN